MTKLLRLAPSTAVLVVEDKDGGVFSEEEISTELIEMGDLLKVKLLLHITNIAREKWMQKPLTG